jgi:ATP-dependent RNA helicase RhlE
MLDMGFKPAVDRIVAQTPRDRQTLFFSATLESGAGKAARSYTRDARRHVHSPVEENSGAVTHRFVHLEHSEKLETLIAELRDGDGRTLVFVRTKRGADRLVKRLGQRGVHSVAMHGNKSQGQRERALASFERGEVPTLVATDVAARGIDVERIARVINFDPPGDHDAYTHRVGRTGRAGRDGTGISFVLPEQRDEMRAIAKRVDRVTEFDGDRAATAPPHARRRSEDRRRRRRGGR